MALNPDQFPVDYPYPRLRESYARRWAIDIANMDSEDGPVHPLRLLEDGRIQAKMITNIHLMDHNRKAAGKLLVENGFKNRKETKKQYSSWYN